MPGNSRDIKRVITAGILANSDITDLVGANVTGEHPVDTDSETVDYPRIVIEFDGGGGLGWEGAYQQQSFALWVYSRKSAGEALQIYDLCRTALHACRLTVTGVTAAVVAQEVSPPFDGWSEGTRAWYVSGRWLARTAG